MASERDGEEGRALARRGGIERPEFEAVIRRAAELSLRRSDTGEPLLSEEEVVRIGVEAGLPREDVREALAEFRSGQMERPGALRWLVAPELVRAARTVSRPPAELAAELDEYMVGGQLLSPVRQSPTRLQYRPAVDWMSKVARAASASARQHYVAAADRVEIHLEPEGEGGTFVEIEVDPKVRGEYAGWVIGLGATAGAGLGFAVTVAAVEGLVLPALAIGVGVALWGGLTWGIGKIAGRAHRRRLGEVRAELEGILDRLESGVRLEPPPPSWRRWVRRHFHGVANDLGWSGFKGREGER